MALTFGILSLFKSYVLIYLNTHRGPSLSVLLKTCLNYQISSYSAFKINLENDHTVLLGSGTSVRKAVCILLLLQESLK